MISYMKMFIKRYMLPLFGIALLQPLYQLLYRLSLVGMNMGPVGEIATSGEARLIKRLMNYAPTNAVIFDVGANVGEFSLRCNQFSPSGAIIYAFEPSPSTYGRLSDNVRSYEANNRIIPVQLGLSDQTREAILSVQAGFEGNASIHAREIPRLGTATVNEKIELTTLDAFCADKNINRVFFLKLDIEGEEFACLRGASRLLARQQIDYLQFEFGGCNIQSRIFLKDFWDLLAPSFVIYRVLQNELWHWKGYHELNEIFTTTNFLAVRRGLPCPD